MIFQYLFEVQVKIVVSTISDANDFFFIKAVNMQRSKTEVPRDVRNSKVRKQEKFRRDWPRHWLHYVIVTYVIITHVQSNIFYQPGESFSPLSIHGNKKYFSFTQVFEKRMVD